MARHSQVVIVGAGAMGCLYACALAKNPRIELTVLDHTPEKVALLRQQGVLVTENGQMEHTPIHVACTSDFEGAADFLLLFVKAHQTHAALAELPGLIGAHTIVVSLQNGLGACLELDQWVPMERLVAGISNHNSTLLGPGKILHAASGATLIGSLSGNMAAVDAVCALFEGTGMTVTPVKEIRRIIWRKLLVNMAINPLTFLLQEKNGFVATDPACRLCVENLVSEGVAVAEADGVTFDRAEILEHIFEIGRNTASGQSSMLQDRRHGRKTEIDQINGAIVQLAQKYHLPTPCNAQLVELVHAVEAANQAW